MSHHRIEVKPYLAKAYGSRSVYLLALMLVAATLNAPSLSQGLYGDDYVHRRFILSHLRGSATQIPWWDMFDSRLPAGAPARESGSLFSQLPWWAAPDYASRLLRPLTAASQFLDYVLWPDTPWAMHLHNIVLVCAIVLIAGALYWHVFQSRLAAWLALLLFVLDGATRISVGWIASRNTILTALFVLLTLWAYARGRIAAPLFLLFAHASSEGAVVAWAYLLPFAWQLDTRPWSKKSRALLPMAVVTFSWFILCAVFGYGVRGSGSYVDPRVDFGLFLRTLAARFPRLLEFQFGMPSDYALMRAIARPNLMLGIGLVYVAVLLIAAFIYARRSPLVMFFVLSCLGALATLCTADVFQRLLLLSSFAAHGLLIAVGAEMLESTRRHANVIRRTALILFVTGTVWLHGFVAFDMPRASAAYGKFYEASILRATASLPNRPLGARIVALNFPDYLRSALIRVYGSEFVGLHRLDFVMICAGPIWFERPSRNELELDAGNRALSEPSTLLVRRASDRLHVGQQFSLAGLDLEVIRVTPDGRPARVRLKGALAAPGLLWVQWSAKQRRFVRFSLPPEGASGWLEP